MPTLATLLLFCTAGLALLAIPGPNHLFIITRSIAQGRRAGLASAFGVETGTLVHITAAAACGASALGGWLRHRPGFWRRQRHVAGGVYLVLGAVAALAGHRRQS